MHPLRENIYWLFSTSLQVIATFVGLLAAGFFFTHGRINDEIEKDETLKEISAEIKSQYYKRFKSLFVITAFSIVLGFIVLYINAWELGWPGLLFELTVWLLNMFNLILAGWFFIFMIDPDIIKHTAQKLVKNNADLFNSANRNSISQSEFIDKFAALDKILRIVATKAKIGASDQGFTPFVELIKELYEKGIINKEQLQELNQISKARNISSHSIVENVEAGLGSSADKLNKELNVINERDETTK